jgi:hypothetical protein
MQIELTQSQLKTTFEALQIAIRYTEEWRDRTYLKPPDDNHHLIMMLEWKIVHQKSALEIFKKAIEDSKTCTCAASK